MGMMNVCEKYAKCHDLPLRIALGLVFITTGFGKLFGTPGIDGVTQMLGGIGFPFPVFWAWVVAIVEFVGAIALFFGLYTRYVAGLLSIVLIVAIVTVKAAQGWGAGLFLDLGLLGASLSLLLSGSTSMCLDKMMEKKKASK